jgi:spermidine synthase
MLTWTIVDSAETHDGTRLELWRRGEEFSIRAAGGELMNSRRHGSEQLLANLSLEAHGREAAPCVLIGGLGCGYTLAATLRGVGPAARVVVSEISPEVVAWNRSVLAHLAQHPLGDPRVEVRVGDVARELESEQSFDLVLLDVDNGPSAFTRAANAALYTRAGLARLRDALRAGGVLGVWSAGDDADFARRLRNAGWQVTEHRVRAGPDGRGRRHWIWVAKRMPKIR